MNLTLIVESLSMDLLRAALGRYKGSLATAERFEQEALKRNQELESAKLKDRYLITLISKTNKSLKGNSVKKAEELLMYSVLFKNLIQAQKPLC